MLSFTDLRIPDSWTLLVGADTGAYMSAAIVAITPEPSSALVLWEGPNYRYVGGGDIELLGLSNPEWAHNLHTAYTHLRPRTTKIHGWVDTNSQFKHELQNYGLYLHGNPHKLELRVEITREYVQARDPIRFWMAPWLTVLPWEMEHATWPDDTTSAGKFERLKRHDHTLDCVEHVLSRRPRTKSLVVSKPESFLQRYLREHRNWTPRALGVDPHLGRQ